MPIKFSIHAIARFQERHISKKLIKEALTHYEKVIQIEVNKFICYHKVGNKTLTIVFIKRREYIKVITVHYENFL